MKNQPNDPVYVASVYRMHGATFVAAARTLADASEHDGVGPLDLPFQLLVAHAAELFLKAALLKRGVPERELRRLELRHDLDALGRLLETRGVVISEAGWASLSAIASGHSAHALRYTALLDDGNVTKMIRPNIAFQLLDELLMLTRISTNAAARE